MLTMKKTNVLCFLGLAALLVVGCSKNIDASNVPFSSIVADRNFNWSSTKPFNLSVAGLTTVNTVNGTFSVIDVKTGATFYSGLHKLSDNLSLKLTIPTATDSLQIRFGSIQKNYSASGTSVQTDYLENVPNE
jgi:PBP1b-binding outer membrane lipoprotein LpoB